MEAEERDSERERRLEEEAKISPEEKARLEKQEKKRRKKERKEKKKAKKAKKEEEGSSDTSRDMRDRINHMKGAILKEK